MPRPDFQPPADCQSPTTGDADDPSASTANLGGGSISRAPQSIVEHAHWEHGTDDEFRPGLQPIRFGLKSLFVIVTATAISISLWLFLGSAIGLMLLILVLVVFAHVAGNALGTKLRDSGGKHHHARSPAAHTDHVRVEHYAPVTRLSHRVPLGKLMGLATVGGAIVGAVAGTWILYRMYPETSTGASLAVGGAASAAFGGFWAFWIGSLAQVFLGAWWQAHRHSNDRR